MYKYSIIYRNKKLAIKQTAWYKKDHICFSDAIESIRRESWLLQVTSHSQKIDECEIIDQQIWRNLIEHIARAA